MGPDDRSVAERRKNLRQVLVVQSLVLVSLVISFSLRVADDEWMPWGLLILVLLVALVGYIAVLAYRLRQLSRSSQRHVDHQTD